MHEAYRNDSRLHAQRQDRFASAILEIERLPAPRSGQIGTEDAWAWVKFKPRRARVSWCDTTRDTCHGLIPSPNAEMDSAEEPDNLA